MAKSLVLIFFISSLFAFGFALAQEVPEGCEDPGSRPKETTMNSWTVQEVSYQCENNECGGAVKQRTIEAEESTRIFHTLEEDENHCPVWETHVVTRSAGATRTSIINTNLGKYQACSE
ncbi:MAG: hypothetical protein Q8O97_00115, partial [bacterium]|nr:hypothetical protein [bacterium]